MAEYSKSPYKACSTVYCSPTFVARLESSHVTELAAAREKVTVSSILQFSTLATKVGEQYTVEQALYGLLLYSANEIAYGLAEHVGGSLVHG